MFVSFVGFTVLYVVGMVLIHHGITLLRMDNTPSDPPTDPPCDERREYCNLKGLDRIIVDVSPRPVPLPSDLANRTNSGRLIRTDEIGQPPLR